MMHRGEMNPFELRKLMTVTAHDYASSVINLLNTMPSAAPKRNEGLLRIQRWIERVLAGEIVLGAEPEWSGKSATPQSVAPETEAPEPSANARDEDDDSADEDDAEYASNGAADDDSED